MKRSLLFLAVLIFTGYAASSQEQPDKNSPSSKHQKMNGGFGYFMSGYQAFDLSGMNRQLIDMGYPELPTGSFSIGGGGHFLLKNWLIGGEGFGLPGSSVGNDNYMANHAGGYGFFNLGYLLWHTPSFFLYPVVGFGGGGMTLNLKEKEEQTTSFPDILASPGREVNLQNGGFMLNLSVLANYMILGEKSAGYSGGFILGVKAGYILNIGGTDWYQNNEKLNDAPSSGISGPYVGIVIGGGGMGSK